MGAVFESEEVRRAAKRHVESVTVDIGRRLRHVWNYGTPIWEREWDLLVVLDACRWDLFCEVAPEYEFIPSQMEWVYSPASMSEEWLEVHTAERFCDELSRTALISGNINTHWKPEFRHRWGYIDEVWKHGWDDESGTVSARAVTDAAIDYVRNRQGSHDTDRTIVWYFQPHRPFVPVEWSQGFEFGRLTDRDRDITQENEFNLYRDGIISRDQLWKGYAANLRYVLDEIELLLRNVATEDVVITSDHANLLGECGVYEHPRDFPHPVLRRVPWVRLSATDDETYIPDYDPGNEDLPKTEIRDRLEHLGYRA